MKKKIIGYFEENSLAEEAVSELKNQGWGDKDISIVQRDENRGSGEDKESPQYGDTDGDYLIGGAVDGVYHLDGGSGTLTGAGIGGAAGLILGAGAFLIPGVGPLVAAGPIATGLIGAATGGVAGALADLGITDDRSGYYEGRVQEGNTLIILESDEERVEEAAKILRNHGAQDVEVHDNERSS